MSSTYVFLFGCALLGLSGAYPSGAPQETCQIFTANHTGHLPQTTKAKYQLIANPSTAAPGSTITVTLQGPNAEIFKGFFIQGQDGVTKKPSGKFLQTTDAQTKDCSGPRSANAVTHVDSGDKTKVSFQWQAPSVQGTVVFRAVVVKTYDRFWNNIYSNSITIA